MRQAPLRRGILKLVFCAELDIWRQMVEVNVMEGEKKITEIQYC